MDALSQIILSLIFLGIAVWLLNRNRYARYMIKPMKRYSWALAKRLLGLVAKLLRRLVSLFDPY